MSDAFALPPLRPELRIEPGAPLPTGAPGFILFDPLRHLFFQLGALEHRVLAKWCLGDAHAARSALVAEGTDPGEAERAICAFHDFAVANSLTREVPGNAVKTLGARHAAARRDWWQWLLDHYLFIRVPLIRPAAFLERSLPTVRRIWAPSGIALLATIGLIGLFLVTRQWDSFTASFAGLLTAQGLLAYAGALIVVKAFHELGHAYTATLFGARVPTMGVSFLVMVPVLYTDTSASWRLRSRRQRMTIDAAGLFAEFSVAAVALFAWSFLPDGPLRMGAFVLATTSLATSVLINASPFMRFDGYYILSDLLGVPNLASRAFALARWRARELLFALGEAPPELLAPALRRAMLVYAAITFVYRATLYVGIALLVYHSFFKALGLALFAVEVSVFLARPIVSELHEWRARKSQILASGRARIFAAITAMLFTAAFLPLDRSVTLPAMLTPLTDTPVVAGDVAQVRQVLVKDGANVVAGQPLLVLVSPDIALGISQSTLRIVQLESQIARGVADREDLADTNVLKRDLIAEKDRLSGLQRRQAALTIRAVIAGRVVDLTSDLRPGMWTDGKTALLRVVTPGRYVVNAYIPEEDSWRIRAGVIGRFVPIEAGTSGWQVRLAEIGGNAIRTLDQPALSEINGGPIATHPGNAKDGLKPVRAIIALRLIAERSTSSGFPQPVTGSVSLPARGESVAARIGRAFTRILVRESSIE